MKENVIKGAVAVVLGGLTAFLGDLAIPIYVLVACNVIDYATGLMSAKARGEQISSYKGIQGIAKKIGQWLLVLVGWLLDVLIAVKYHDLLTILFINMPVYISTTVLVPENIGYIFTDKIRLTIYHKAADRAKFRIVENL